MKQPYTTVRFRTKAEKQTMEKAAKKEDVSLNKFLLRAGLERSRQILQDQVNVVQP